MSGLGDDLAALRTECRDMHDIIGDRLDDLDRRIAELEAVAAARWPARILAAARLGRSLRLEVRHWPGGGSWAQRRIEQAGNDLTLTPDEAAGEQR